MSFIVSQMKGIRQIAGEQIAKASVESEIPEAFLAALIGNESGGKVDARRFEQGVFAKLADVALGVREAYTGIVRGHLYPKPSEGERNEDYTFRALRQLKDAATSWGWTQIMGYHMLRWQAPIAHLLDKTLHLSYTARLLGEFIETYKLKPTEYEKLARCWNTGKPGGVFYDPAYFHNLSARMEAWDNAHEPGE